MYQGIRPLVTTGVAIVGASVIAVSPLTVPPPATILTAPLPAAQQVAEMSDVQLAGLVENLTAVGRALAGAPGQTVTDIVNQIESIPLIIDAVRDLPPGQAISVILSIAGTAYKTPYTNFLEAFLVNLPSDPSEADLFDAIRLSSTFAVSILLGLPTIPLNIAGQLAAGDSPGEVLESYARNYLATLPLILGQYFVGGLTNTLPSPIGGVPDPTATPEEQGAFFQASYALLTAYSQLIQGVLGPQQMIANKEVGVAKEVVPVDTWPPNAERVVRTVQNVGAELREVPGELFDELAENVRVVGQYLKQGRPLDAVRYLAAHSFDLPTRWSEIPLELSSTFLPPQLDRIVKDVVVRTNGFAHDIADEIEPGPLTKTIDHKQITPSGINAPQSNPGNFVNLSLPENKNVDEITNVGLNKGIDQSNGNQVTKQDNNRPKVGSNVRAVVKEVRKEIRSTIKDVRQGVRDVVKAVTGLGKKMEVKTETNESPKPGE